MNHLYEELGEASRRHILAELRSGAKRVSDLVGATGLKQPNVSNHLARLRTRGIVESNKVGREVYYTFATPEVGEAVRIALQEPETDHLPLPLPESIERYAELAITGGEGECSAIFDDLLRDDLSLLALYVDFLTPAMALIGQWYKEGRIDEAQEHLASGITERVAARAMLSRAPIAHQQRTAVLGLPPDCHHALGLRMVSDYLKLLGWKTLFLGANVPLNSFRNLVETQRVDYVLTSCATEANLKEVLGLLKVLGQIRNDKRRFVIGVGGGSAQAHSEALKVAGADFVARDLREFALMILPSLES